MALRGLLWRPPLSAAIFLAAVVTAGGTVLGPLYARAATESTLRDELAQAPVADTGLQLQATNRFYAATELQLTRSEIDRSFAEAPTARSLRGYRPGVGELFFSTYAAASPVAALKTALVWRSGVCGQLHFTAGRCPSGAGEAAVSARTVAFAPYGWRLGGRLRLSNGRTVRIVGVYRPKETNAPYWFGHNYFDAGPNASSADSVDTIFVAKATFDALPARTLLQGSVDYLLDPQAIRLADVPTLRSTVLALQHRLQSGSVFTVSTNLSQVLDRAAHDRKLVNVGAGVVTAQMTLLGCLVLFLIMVDAIEARGADIAVAKLRGLSPGGIWRFGLTEPLLLLVAAMPVGFVVGVAGATAFAAVVLVPGTPVLIPWGALFAVAGAFTGGLVAGIAAARGVIRRSVLDQWRHTSDRSTPRGRAILMMEIAVSLAAVAGLVTLRVLPEASGAALLAPGLFILAVALLGTRLIPAVAHALTGPTRATRRIGMFLAARQVARRPAGLRLAALLAVAVGLACFGVGGETVAIANRDARASAEVGADTVVSIQYDDRVDPVAAVRRADPDGRWAAAAATWLPDGGTSVNGTVLAVDASRLAAVGAPARGGLSTAALATLLRSHTVPAVVLHGTSIRATITGQGIAPHAAPVVQFDLLDSEGKPVDAAAGTLKNGGHTYAATVACTGGCTFVGFTWYRPFGVDGAMTGSAAVTALAGGSGTLGSLGARVADPDAWRAATPEGQASDRIRSAKNGVEDRFDAENGGYGGMAYAYTPDPIPVVASPAAIVTTTPVEQRAVADGYGASAAIRVARYTAVLPEVLSEGAIADLTAVRAQLPAFDGEANWQVWLGPNSPADAIHRLKAAGLTVQSVATRQAREAELAREAPALSLLLLLVGSCTGAILAMGATAVSVAAGARRRSYESAALRVVRVPKPALYRAAALEQVLLLGGAVVIGVPAGIAAAIITLPALPEFSTSTPVHLDYLPAPLPLVAFALLFAVLVAATALTAASVVMRQAVPSRLREGEG